MLSAFDRKIISLISKDIPLVANPFSRLSSCLGIAENKLLKSIKQYKKSGLLRKFSAVINHRKVGFRFNAMVVWNIPNKAVGRAGNIIASFGDVSHCYQRRKTPSWNYNLYAMIHAKTKLECLSTAKRISKKIGFSSYRILFSSKEFKKVSVLY